MLEKLSRDPPPETTLDENAQLIPDPWDIPNIPSEQIRIPENWKIPAQHHLLIEAAGSPLVPRLAAPKREPELSIIMQILLQGELKLKAGDRSVLANQIKTALALLSWMEMVRHLSAIG